jgi:molybdopterin-containing oxidoreductase family iron-sulfur binding subunit
MSISDLRLQIADLKSDRRLSLPVCDEQFTVPSNGDANRRDFLKAAGFAVTGAILSGCGRAPVQEAVTPINAAEKVVSGPASVFASTCGACAAECGMLVKTRDGRPIKLEGDPEHALSKGGLCAAGQASLLGLYDRKRLQHPLVDGRETRWAELDRGIRGQLDSIRRQGGAVRVLSGTITSPTTRALIRCFLDGFQDARHVVYDPVSCSAILDAHEQTHGVRVLPHYRLDKAEVIAAFDADFLGTWISPVEFTSGYRAGRTLTGNPPRSSYHIHVESRLSLTGSKADERLCIAPDEMGTVINRLATELSRRAGAEETRMFEEAGFQAAADLSPSLSSFCDRLAARLWQARGRSLVLCGSQDIATHLVCNFINHLLGNYSKTLDIERASAQRQGSDRELQGLLQELEARKVAALLILDSNPAYDLPEGESLAATLRQVPLVIFCGERSNETASAARYVCPHPHYLESWGDAEPVNGVVSLRQPTIPRFGDTRPLIESLAAWSTSPTSPAAIWTLGLMAYSHGPLLASAAFLPRTAYDLLRDTWAIQIFPRQAKERKFDAFWESAVRDGHVELTPAKTEKVKDFNKAAVRPIKTDAGAKTGLSLVLHPKVGLLDGNHAYNPWLQELPDPLSKVTWDNYASVSPAAAEELKLSAGDVVSLELPDQKGQARSLELPVNIQPGQHDGIVAVALGYGSLASKRFADVGPPWLEHRPTVGENGLVGTNAAPLLTWENNTLRYVRTGVKLTRTGKNHPLASTQDHHTLTVPAHLAPPGLERRPIIQETTVAELARVQTDQTAVAEDQHADLWPDDHPFPERRWGMVIDLNACTGCSACMIACQAENNVPVVGKDEVQRHRDMHWLRIDRYYSGTGAELDVAHQPMLCQHCEKAPCETVCPVLATTHSAEGLNEQVYNRCVGTRYCANNCPYKVRRFNWFAYAHDDTLQNLALNPNVTVRSRGVMEKCTFCVQRIEEARIEARRQGKPLADGDVQTACQQSCPAQAIVFGDMKDPKSRVAQSRKNPRHYHVLGELNIGPSVGYLKVVRPDKGAHTGGQR